MPGVHPLLRPPNLHGLFTCACKHSRYALKSYISCPYLTRLTSSTQVAAPDPKSQITRKERTMKNLLAAIGLMVVIKKGYELHREYSELKRALSAREKAQS